MSDSNRRDFIKKTGVGVASAAALNLTRRRAYAGANSQVNVGLIGCGGRGMGVATDTYAKLDNVKITHVCDINTSRLAAAAKKLDIPERNVMDDMRKVYDDPDVDAVYVATPDHWHSPAGILACDARKHVYVEKPCSHNVREGRLFVEAARRNDRVVQHGTQVRSTQMMIDAVQALREGIIGEVLVAKCWNIQKRGSIGHGTPEAPPKELDYENWVGPCPMIPYQRNRVGSWHWWYHFGTGDMGNDGVHDVDYCRWGLGVDTQPTTVTAVGGKYFFDDDREFPDTQQVTFEYPADGKTGNQRMFIFEMRLWSRNYPSVYNVDSGAEFYGTEGRMFLSRRGKVQVLDAKNNRKKFDIKKQFQDTDAHVADFVDAIREGRKAKGDILEGHLSASLCHLGNLATRLGRSFKLDPETEQVVGDEEANALLKREYRDHWGTPKGA